jgi:hypothetical protein
MRFYELPGKLAEAVERNENAVRVQFRPDGVRPIPWFDVVSADFWSLREKSGGVVSHGDVVVDNTSGDYSMAGMAGAKVEVWFSVGEKNNWFHRFTLFADGQGYRDIKGPGGRRLMRMVLVDRAEALKKTVKMRDWTNPVVLTYVKVADKAAPKKSLVHLLAKQGKITDARKILCSTIPMLLPYVKVTKSVWAELSALARAYRCHLEFDMDGNILFDESPYQNEAGSADGVSYVFHAGELFYLRSAERADDYRNTVRLKYNAPVALEKTLIWSFWDYAPQCDADGRMYFWLGICFICGRLSGLMITGILCV